MTDERYVDCEQCDERFVGEEAIASYIREVVVSSGHCKDICIGCLERNKKQTAAKKIPEQFSAVNFVAGQLMGMAGRKTIPARERRELKRIAATLTKAFGIDHPIAKLNEAEMEKSE